MSDFFSDKQNEYILNANAKHNLAHGPVRCGKTYATFFRFLQEAIICPGEQIWVIGYTQSTIYHNCIRLLLDGTVKQYELFNSFCRWSSHTRELKFGPKTITCVGAADESAVSAIQGKTFDLCYCNEMTLFPLNVLQMIATRLSMPYSKLYADMNPSTPDHFCKKWIDLAREGDPNYYELQFSIDDNPYLTETFKEGLRKSLSGVFFRRNYLGEWCTAEGAIFPFFDKQTHCADRIKGTTMYWIAGIDYGTANAFAGVLIRISKFPDGGMQMWVEKEYYHSGKLSRPKSPSEYANDMEDFFKPYAIKSVYLDPSALAFKTELGRRGIHVVDKTDNDVEQGIITLIDEFSRGRLIINPTCVNLIREIQGYVWDEKRSKLGFDEPKKENDHAVDALRYAVRSYVKNRKSLGEEDDRFGGSLVGKQHEQRMQPQTIQNWPMR